MRLLSNAASALENIFVQTCNLFTLEGEVVVQLIHVVQLILNVVDLNLNLTHNLCRVSSSLLFCSVCIKRAQPNEKCLRNYC